ncbi:uncharacterized protein LOC105680374 [Bombus impatiens]|uniref:Uncharacterized protein LOC105680374 n=1 Tax=Bombus impatiens TaxID=132113 RepID=A0A6P3UN42_BOMIM|nr:uncharacterized protein LOC105680374 [Bombus impatiens]
MSRLTAWIAALFILIGSVWSQEQILEEGIEEPRFGFGLLEPIRIFFCKNSCESTEGKPYILNLACAVKCPELYLPHTTSKPPTSTIKSSSSPAESSMPAMSMPTATNSMPTATNSMPTTTNSMPTTMRI